MLADPWAVALASMACSSTALDHQIAASIHGGVPAAGDYGCRVALLDNRRTIDAIAVAQRRAVVDRCLDRRPGCDGNDAATAPRGRYLARWLVRSAEIREPACAVDGTQIDDARRLRRRVPIDAVVQRTEIVIEAGERIGLVLAGERDLQ